ncbi:hypothetical protein BO83DRAFT_173722 [Aspergillus eucalypticola CBS 122712]|uniref:Secreted protein n=1 Tax=Aspergillus eucalypticola (strain CBS 122712 / IBT 29274) TaxID=1448314 RepID=A0A317W8C7_ASPEC|nr:uncharacterized protein BO83DRAFT_173722 [Aspergillus eucalypticola CBS 122712]PWY81288.1 hypothetical protein BO83DRAFT_173722 [Aspergillus eucalypticola CBS 122712]
MSGRLMGCTLYPLCISLPRLLLFLDPTSSQVSGTWRSETLALEDSLSETPWAGMYHQPKGLTGRSVYRRRSSLLFFHKNSLLCIPPFPKKTPGTCSWLGHTYVVTQGKNNGHKHQGTAFRGTRPVYTRAEPILMRWDRMAL